MEKFFLRCAMLDDCAAPVEPAEDVAAVEPAAADVAPAEHEPAVAVESAAADVVGCGVAVVAVEPAGAADERRAVTHQKHHLPYS